MTPRRVGVAAGAVALVAVGTGAGFAAMNRGAGPAGMPPKPGTATAEITRGDLVDAATVDGILTFAGERTVRAARSGVITSVPARGKVIGQGDPLFKVGRRPLVLMYGTLPVYRPLRRGASDGPDVRQLERALRTLGHGAGLTVDDHFSAATARAVRDWQDDNGLAETGQVDAAQIVFMPSSVRLARSKAAVGDRTGPGRPVLVVTGTRQVVRVDLDAADRNQAREGATVTVELPGGETVQGKIISVGTVAEKKKRSASESAQDPAATVDVEITLRRQENPLDQAPVVVRLENERRGNVLSVPVEALLALRGGGYGVELVDPGGARRALAVRTGMYGGGRVEISGSGLAPGMRVGVPAQ